MKRFLILVAAVLLAASCSVLTHERFVDVYFLDYRPYTEAGFFISPDPYPGAFDALGEIQIKVIPAVQPRNSKPVSDVKFKDGAYGGGGAVRVVREVIDGSELLDMVYNEAVARGADGIADFHCRATYTTFKGISTLSGYEINALAIKRK